MATYDFKSAKEYIEMHRDRIESASMGMHEDWFWTSETVFKNGEFTKDFDADGLQIGGIDSSFWATPTLEIQFKDGNEERKDCYTGDVGGQKPDWFQLGPLSAPVQAERECDQE
jgi:hypothetical protein